MAELEGFAKLLQDMQAETAARALERQQKDIAQIARNSQYIVGAGILAAAVAANRYNNQQAQSGPQAPHVRTGVYSYNPKVRRWGWVKLIITLIILSPVIALAGVMLFFGAWFVVAFTKIYASAFPILWVPVGLLAAVIVLAILGHIVEYVPRALADHRRAQARRKAWGKPVQAPVQAARVPVQAPVPPRQRPLESGQRSVRRSYNSLS